MKKLIIPLLACIVCAVIVSVIAVSVRYEQNLNKENEKKEKILLAAGYGDPDDPEGNLPVDLSVDDEFTKIKTVYVDFVANK